MENGSGHLNITSRISKDPVMWITISTLCLMIIHFIYQPDIFSRIGVEKIHKFESGIFFQQDIDGVTVRTFLPQENNRQKIIRETMNSGNLAYSTNEEELGRQAIWSGTGTNSIHYNAILSISAVEYQIDRNLTIDSDLPEEIKRFLDPTDAIPTDHPEIHALWQSISPPNNRLLMPVIKSIYDYTYNEIESAPFKGFTDALTALRLKQASCNGKSRLFVSLARQNGIPARLIGGIILDVGRKKTSHQWVEVYIQGHWVPFDPTNGHFARIPDHYMQLYIGDKALFSHTRNINFDYYFSGKAERIPSALVQSALEDAQTPNGINAIAALAISGMTDGTARIFLLFPFCTLVIAFLRNVVGLRTLGVFVPMLIAAACVYTGLLIGLSMFVAVLFFAFLSHWYLEKLNMLKVPRLAATITICTILIVGLIIALDIRQPLQLGMLSLFPIVIISFLAERIHELAAEHDWLEMTVNALGSLISIVLCYATFTSLALQSIFAVAPELLLLVLALLIYIGRWPGIRLVEYFRFRKIIGMGEILGINNRNLNFINPKNSKELLELAIDKLRTKDALTNLNIPTTETIIKCENQRDIPAFLAVLKKMDSGVIKPNRGSKGKGIMVITGRDNDNFVTAGGKVKTIEDLRSLLIEILTGAYSQDGNLDIAYLEPLVIQYGSINKLASLGLADIRIILHEGEPVSAMLRLPTQESGGKANLHQGAIGLSIDLKTGKATNAAFKGKPITAHPDTNAELIGFKVPYWSQIMKISLNCFDAVPLGYLGVDICIDHVRGPLVLEVNGRPGLEIQNVRNKGLKNELAQAGQEG